jgi:hypothetical protein
MRPSRQARTTRRFEQRSAWWDHIDQEASLEGRILRRRQQVTLTWVEQLSLSYPAGLRVLEIGCGAGATAVELARRSHLVTALDRSPAMLQHTRNHALISGVGELVTPILGNAHRLLFPTGTFDLVLAGGVRPGLRNPRLPSKRWPGSPDQTATSWSPRSTASTWAACSTQDGPHCSRRPGAPPGSAPPDSVGAPPTESGPPGTRAGGFGGNCAAAGCSPSARPPSGSDPSASSAGPCCPAIGPSESTRPSSAEPTTTTNSSGQRTAAPHPGPQARPRQNLNFAWFHRLVLIREHIAEPTGPITVPAHC